MKFIHLSDLHIGKRVNEYSMHDDQKYILNEIMNIIDEEKPDGILIAGDVYDKSIPTTEAVELFDNFLYLLSKRSAQVFIISGNHDSVERLAFGSRLIDKSGIHLSRTYDGHIEPFTMTDEFGETDIYMLPFLKPGNVRRFFEDEEISSYTDGIRVAVNEMNINKERRNILIAHQFVTGSLRAESEEISVGGSDNVDVAVFEDFDYVALGHLHRPQNCMSEKVRYCGTPLKYSFSEAKDKKSVTVVEIREKGNLSVRTVELKPKRDMVEIKGTFAEVTDKSFYENTTYQEDYTHITLTDEEDIPDGIGKLRVIYHNLMKFDYDNKRTRQNLSITGAEDVETKSPLELFEEFYELTNNQPMSDEQRELVCELMSEIRR